MTAAHFNRDKVKIFNCGYVGKPSYSGRPFGAEERWKVCYFHRGGRGIKCEPLNAVRILPARTKNLKGDTASPYSLIPSLLKSRVF